MVALPTTKRRAAGRSWLHLMVRVDLGSGRARLGSPRLSRDVAGFRQLLQLERWLKDHHIPQSLFDRYGAPRSDTVHAFFRSDQPEKALAFRGLCNELGLGGRLDQVRIAVNSCSRLRPPLLDLMKGGL